MCVGEEEVVLTMKNQKNLEDTERNFLEREKWGIGKGREEGRRPNLN